MNKRKSTVEKETPIAFGAIIQKISENCESIDQRLQGLETKFHAFANKTEGEFVNLDYRVKYIVERFKTEPFLCDPAIKEGDLVCVNNQQESKHRIVKGVSTEGITIFEEKNPVIVKYKDCRKVGHSPTHRYLVIQDLLEYDIENKNRKKTDQDNKNESITSKIDTLQHKVEELEKLLEQYRKELEDKSSKLFPVSQDLKNQKSVPETKGPHQQKKTQRITRSAQKRYKTSFKKL